MPTNPRFIMIGGFLGAGKTTTVARLARHYQAQGDRVAIVTNDQAKDLVDTHLLRSQGFDVGEVAGSCFCCNFRELTNTVEHLSDRERPDVIIAEPVGSCTDLVATVIRPLQYIYQKPFAIAPFGVLIKPSHGLKILRRESKGGFSPQAAYIFRKQIEEADFVIINRIDELSKEVIEEIELLLREQFPGIPSVRFSAHTGEGFEEMCAILDQGGRSGSRVMEVDYDIYAEGEAELGWLNAQLDIAAESHFDLDRFLTDLLSRIHGQLIESEGEIAHLKVIGISEGKFAVANMVQSHSQPSLSIASGSSVRSAEVVVNARVAIDPELLKPMICNALEVVCQSSDLRLSIRTMQSFRPGRPVPTHRLT